MLDAIRARAQTAVQERTFPGCVIGVLHNARTEYVCIGGPTYEAGGAVSEDSLYDVASITKSIPTASLASILVHEKELSLDEPVVSYLPDFRHDYGATIRDLLLYRVSGNPLSQLKNLSADEIYAHVYQTGFSGPPGNRCYSNLPAFVLGLVIERVSGTDVRSLAQRYLFEPLGMLRTDFFTGAVFSSAVPTEIDSWRGTVQGCTHDESAYVLGRAGRASGHAGLFSTAQDLLAFARALLLSEGHIWETIATHAETGLGWQTGEVMSMGSHTGSRAFGKTGFTGTSILIDRSAQTALVILSNRTFPNRPHDTDAINAFRSDVADLVWGAIRS